MHGAANDKEAGDYRAVIWGMAGDTPWTPVLPEEGLKGLEADDGWQRESDGLIGARTQGSAVLKFGGKDWKDYEIDFRVTVIQGANLDVGFRASVNKAYVFKFLFGWQACTVTVRDLTGASPLDHLSVVNHPLVRNRDYHVQIAARGASITTYVDGRLVNQVTDKTLKSGRSYLEVWQGKARFQDVRCRRIA